MFSNFVLLFLSIFTRFFGQNWGNGFFLHPDENNMASALAKLSFKSLNPHFFAYNQFPLYLAYFTYPAQHPLSFAQSIFALRFWSAFFNVFSLFYFYQIANILYPKTKTALIFCLLLIFNPGLIQVAHFGTTESILVFVFAFIIYQSIKYYKKPNFLPIFFSALIGAIGIATKVTAIIFLLPMILAIFSKKSKTSPILITSYYLLVTILISCFLTPYSLIALPEFLSSLRYETAVARGTLKVFYTNQFLGSIPYWFQFKYIFPYVSGLPVFIFSFFGIKKFLQKQKIQHQLLLLPVLIYFLLIGCLYVKWTRFMAPIFFIFPLLASIFLTNIKNNLIRHLLICLAIIPGVLFLSQYFLPNVRLKASYWINQNIPNNAKLLTESRNVLDLPLIKDKDYSITSYDFYDLDNRPQLFTNLKNILKKTDYIIIPSRRVFKNQMTQDFPYTQKYYNMLFSDNLGFKNTINIVPVSDFLLNPENAEETWSIFDRPVIRIYEKR